MVEPIILVVLFCACTAYAVVLEGFDDRYHPWLTWLTVVIGDGFIWLALADMEALGVRLTAWHVFRALCVGGAPIIVWQLWQNWGRLMQLLGGSHGSAPRRTADIRSDRR